MTGVCGVEIIASSEPTDGCTVSACTKCYDALVEELIEEESIDHALDRGYEPVTLED